MKYYSGLNHTIFLFFLSGFGIYSNFILYLLLFNAFLFFYFIKFYFIWRVVCNSTILNFIFISISDPISFFSYFFIKNNERVQGRALGLELFSIFIIILLKSFVFRFLDENSHYIFLVSQKLFISDCMWEWMFPQTLYQQT